MMGLQNKQKELFGYNIDLDRRVRADNPLRQVAAQVDFSFARAEVEHKYGDNGNVSVDPEVILKMMFLLFWDNISSERELMRIIAERLDYLWFLGYGLNDELPDHSVLSKARARWGSKVFERLFVRTVEACVAAGLVEGNKIHMDGSLIAANASTKSVITSSPEMVAALRQVYQEQTDKLTDKLQIHDHEQPAPSGLANATRVSKTDPEAELVRRANCSSHPSYKHHRVVDNAQGVITAQVTSRATVMEDTQLPSLVDQHQQNTGMKVNTVTADTQYGTIENLLECVDRHIEPHMADLKTVQDEGQRRAKFFSKEQFVYERATDTYKCPAGQLLKRRQKRADRGAYQYLPKAGTCDNCPLRAQCTDAKGGRRITRSDREDELERARAITQSRLAVRDRVRRKHLMERSFADAANSHGFKRARWRGLWRQLIQNHLIAACQNLRILFRKALLKGRAAAAIEIIEAIFPSANRQNGLIRIPTCPFAMPPSSLPEA